MSSRGRGGTYWQGGRASFARLAPLRAPRMTPEEIKSSAARLQRVAEEAVARQLALAAAEKIAEDETHDAARHDLREENGR